MAKSINFYTNLKSNLESVRVQYVGLWSLISKIVGTGETYGESLGELTFSEDSTLDRQTYDPMCKRAVETVCDYYASLVFPTVNPFHLVANMPESELRSSDIDWFNKQSDKLVDALYSSDSGFFEGVKIYNPSDFDGLTDAFTVIGSIKYENDFRVELVNKGKREDIEFTTFSGLSASLISIIRDEYAGIPGITCMFEGE